MSANGNSTKLDLTTLHTLIYWCQKDQNFYNKSSLLLETHDENEIRVRIHEYTNTQVTKYYAYISEVLKAKHVLLRQRNF